MDWIDLIQNRQVANSCEHATEPSGYMKGNNYSVHSVLLMAVIRNRCATSCYQVCREFFLETVFKY
jgi:hypothetical protein